MLLLARMSLMSEAASRRVVSMSRWGRLVGKDTEGLGKQRSWGDVPT